MQAVCVSDLLIRAVRLHGDDTTAFLHAACARLAAYKLPKDVHVIETLSTTRFGKIDKKQLRAAIPTSKSGQASA